MLMFVYSYYLNAKGTLPYRAETNPSRKVIMETNVYLKQTRKSKLRILSLVH